MAKKEHYYTRFENDGIYHIYNRTVDRKPMFTSDRNYAYFIRQFDKYLSNYIKIYAYNLLGNHFHFMIKVNDLKSIQKLSNVSDGNNTKTDLETLKKLPNQEKTTHDIISHQLKKFFQSYAMSFNKEQNRIGTLFQTPFKRVRVENENYLRELACYINTNAQKHNLVKDFRDWKWSSYPNTISNKDTKLIKEELISYFGDIDNFIYCHLEYGRKIDSIERDFFIED
jgi:REP element-mobilizing transposase RayT